MSEAWRLYAHAPAPGTRICAAEEAPAAGTRCFDLDGFPILLVRVEGRIMAYVNACPHHFLPLNHRGERLLSADGTVIRCTNHGAGFLAATGEGVEGAGIGAALDRIPVDLNEKGDVIVG
ncbi:Rieske (2Fe-2S) protein [Pikeienuella sp. HZG-20]|uniref:Rieske (2Fe-2S) protein n=1 Tax=Paludibacillus litoralis TaxID=3133267 RepID=UPI0030EB74FA